MRRTILAIAALTLFGCTAEMLEAIVGEPQHHPPGGSVAAAKTPQERAQALVERYRHGYTERGLKDKAVAPDLYCSQNEHAARAMEEALRIWPEVPHARYILAQTMRVCWNRTLRQVCHPPRPDEPELVSAVELIDEEMRISPANQEVLSFRESLQQEVRERREASDNEKKYAQLVERMAGKARVWEGLPSASEILTGGAGTQYLDFCLAEPQVEASARNFTGSDKYSKFELVSDSGMHVVIGPPLPDVSDASEIPDDTHIFARVDGVMNAMNNLGVTVAVPKLRAVAIWNSATFLWIDDVHARGMVPSKKRVAR